MLTVNRLPFSLAMFVSSIARVSVCLLCLSILAACSPSDQSPAVVNDGPPIYVGSESCSGCHRAEFDAWQGSHHALAMQHATIESVLGDFSGIEFEYFGRTSTFYMRDGQHFVQTDDANGELREFTIAYTFGVEPLQQYMVEFPGGKIQPLPFAWDVRPVEQGGQRWFHVYPDDEIDASDPLHWTGREQNWNFMCAECHSTDLDKHYRADTDTFDTTWFEINVGCEGCHGPGSRHLQQAEADRFRSRAGFLVDLDDAGGASWVMNPETGIASRSEIRMQPPIQPEACGRCHSRRSVVSGQYEFGRPLLDTHMVSLLDEPLYFADGQILEEVYVYGSFLQSRMYQAGVTCSDCHEPHAATLRTGPNPDDICATCHLTSKFSTAEHHHHPENVVGCADCHMQTRDYMVVDPRHDHSFRIPRPDLTIETGSPNACNACHADRDVPWASENLVRWFGDDLPDHYGSALHAGRAGAGNQPLVSVIGDAGNPGIVRATALTLLRPPYSQRVAETIRSAIGSGDPLVRFGALRALSGLQQDLQVDWSAPLLKDPVRSVRTEAVRLISPMRALLHIRDESNLVSAEKELENAYLATAERPESQVELGNLYAERGDAGLSEATFRRAMTLAADMPGPRVNLADLYRRLDRDADAEMLLRDGLDRQPDEAVYRHSLGLLLVRQSQPEAGLDELRRAVELQPANARFTYVYAVALNSMGWPKEAVDFLFGVRAKFSGEFDINWALVTMLRDQGRTAEARAVATDLVAIYPDVIPVQNLLQSL